MITNATSCWVKQYQLYYIMTTAQKHDHSIARNGGVERGVWVWVQMCAGRTLGFYL